MRLIYIGIASSGGWTGRVLCLTRGRGRVHGSGPQGVGGSHPGAGPGLHSTPAPATAGYRQTRRCLHVARLLPGSAGRLSWFLPAQGTRSLSALRKTTERRTDPAEWCRKARILMFSGF